VASIELGAENYSVAGYYNGKPASGIAIQLASVKRAAIFAPK